MDPLTILLWLGIVLACGYVACWLAGAVIAVLVVRRARRHVRDGFTLTHKGRGGVTPDRYAFTQRPPFSTDLSRLDELSARREQRHARQAIRPRRL